jgi:exo-beta-1,3-glucanase (GH17 family)
MKTGIIRNTMKTHQLIVMLFSLLALFSCNTNHQNQKEMGDNTQTTPIIKQSEKDLLGGTAHAVCYSGFRSGQHPDRGDGAKNPSYDEILEDLKIITEEQKFNLIRIYDSGENSQMVLKAIKDNDMDIKVMLGIWLQAELSNDETCEWLTEPIPEEELAENKLLNLEEIDRAIQLAKQYPEIIIAINVGNEALVDWNDHKVATDTIISYVKKVKASVDQLVTVADNYKWWADHGKELAEVCDFVSLHIYPVWEGQDINVELSYTKNNYMEVRNTLPTARIVITEAGWPSVASEFGHRASEEKQLQYYQGLMSWAKEMNITTFWFEAFDEDWKGDPNDMMGAEKHWGLYTVDRKPKKVMQNQMSTNNI